MVSKIVRGIRMEGQTDGRTDEGDSKGPSTDGGETKNQTIPMNQSEEKLEKPNF